MIILFLAILGVDYQICDVVLRSCVITFLTLSVHFAFTRVAPTPSSTTGDLLYGMLAEAKALSARRTQYADQLNNEVLSRIDTLIRDTTFISRKVGIRLLFSYNPNACTCTARVCP